MLFTFFVVFAQNANLTNHCVFVVGPSNAFHFLFSLTVYSESKFGSLVIWRLVILLLLSYMRMPWTSTSVAQVHFHHTNHFLLLYILLYIFSRSPFALVTNLVSKTARGHSYMYKYLLFIIINHGQPQKMYRFLIWASKCIAVAMLWCFNYENYNQIPLQS